MDPNLTGNSGWVTGSLCKKLRWFGSSLIVNYNGDIIKFHKMSSIQIRDVNGPPIL